MGQKKTTTTEFPKGIAAMTFCTPVPGGGGYSLFPTVGYTGGLHLKRGAFLKLAYTKGYGKPCILAKKDYATESERLKTGEKRDDYGKFYYFGLSLRYKKGVQFCCRYMKGVPFW